MLSRRFTTDLDEAGVVGAAAEELVDVARLRERDRAVELLLQLGEPLPLLRAIAVGACRGLGLEPGEEDDAAIRRDPARRAEEAGRTGPQLGLPAVTDPLHPFDVAGLSFHDLDEHGVPLSTLQVRRMVLLALGAEGWASRSTTVAAC
jgi:hypothetical protein